MRLQNKIAIVTGAAMGIGQAIALRFAQEGADIMIADILLPDAKKTAQEIRKLGRKAIAVKTDVTKYAQVEAMVQKAVAEFGKIDILVNNAGVDPVRAILPEMTEKDWDTVVDINLKGYFLCSMLASREMLKQKSGKIVNISSIASFTTYSGQLAYVVSKSGVNGLTLGCAIDLAPYHINVNAIAPGSTVTHQLRIQKEAFEKRRVKVPLGKLAQPEDIAGVALFLASADSDHMTGRVLVVDGGEIVNRSYD